MSTPVVDHRAPAGNGAHAGAAPLAARVLRQAGYETGTALRNGEQLLVTVVLPCSRSWACTSPACSTPRADRAWTWPCPACSPWP